MVAGFSLETEDLPFTKRIQMVLKCVQHHTPTVRSLCEFTRIWFRESIVPDPVHLRPPEGCNMMELLNYSPQSLDIYAHHIPASWKLYTWNRDTIYQVSTAGAGAAKATVCIVDDCVGSVCFPLLSLRLLTKTWKGACSVHITLLINKRAGGATRRR